MRRRSFIIAGAMAVGLALGVALGPAATSTTASAQTAATAAAPGAPLWGTFLDQLASALKIQRSALDGAVATASDGTLDQAVAAGTLTQAQADDIAARVKDGDVGALFGGPGGRGGRGGRGGPPEGRAAHDAAFAAAAAKLNLTADELRTKLRDGATLADLASAAGTTEQAVTDTALAAAKAKLDEAVAAGTLTQAQADAAYAHMQEHGADLLMHGGRGPGGPPPADQPSPDAAPAGATGGA